MIVEATVTMIAALAAVAQAHYSRLAALPSIKLKEACSRLSRLRRTLEDIVATGNEIGRRREILLNGPVEKDEQLSELIQLLETQNHNLENAESDFKFLADAFEVQSPRLGKLVVHLRGKRDRIEILNAFAQSLQRQVDVWEVSEMIEEPRQLVPRLVPELRLSSGLVMINVSMPEDHDEDFQQISNAIPTLQEFTKTVCELQHLVK